MNDTLLTIDELRNVRRKFHQEVEEGYEKSRIPLLSSRFLFPRIFIKSFNVYLSSSIGGSPSIPSVIFPIVEFYLFVYLFVFFCGVLVGGGVFERIRDERGLNRNIVREN